MREDDEQVLDTVIVCATSEEHTEHAYTVSRKMRNKFPVLFIGVVPEKKLTDIYKRYEKEGVRSVVSVDGTTLYARNLSLRETKSGTYDTVIKHI